MSSSGTVDKNILQGIPEISQDDLEHISPLHQIIAKELIDAGKLRLIEKAPSGG